MSRWKRLRRPRQDRRANQERYPIEVETEADALAEGEVDALADPAAEDPVEEQNNEMEDVADVVETAEGEAAQGADVSETPRRRKRKRRSRSNRGQPSSTPENRRRETRETRIAGMIFMCNAVTKKDCFKYGVFGFPEQKRDIVEQVKRGMKLFLFDIDKKYLHGIYEARSGGGMDLVPEAFQESGHKFPAQVRFRIHKDCVPIAESDFKQAIQDNYIRENRFRNELTSEQVGKLMRLFRPLDSEGSPQPWRGRDARREPASWDARRGPSRDQHARDPARHAFRPAPPVPARDPTRHVSRPAPPVPAREPVYFRDSTSLYAREHPPIDWDYYHTQPSYLPALQIEVAEAEAARRRYLDNLYGEQTSLIAQRPLLPDPLYRGAEYKRELPARDPLLHDPLYRGVEYQREIPYSSYGGSGNSRFPR